MTISHTFKSLAVINLQQYICNLHGTQKSWPRNSYPMNAQQPALLSRQGTTRLSTRTTSLYYRPRLPNSMQDKGLRRIDRKAGWL